MSDEGATRMEVFPDAEAAAEAAAGIIRSSLRQGLAKAGRAAFAGSGGSSPRETYRLVAHADLNWSRVDVTLTDERWVEPTSPDSNERMLRENLLVGAAAEARFIPLWRPDCAPESAAARVDLALAIMPPFDVVMLGMGADGHIASLFPHNPALAEGLDPDGARLALCIPQSFPAPPQIRVTLTLRALLNAETIILLTAGAAKKQTLEAAFAGKDLPVRALLTQDRAPVRVLWSP